MYVCVYVISFVCMCVLHVVDACLLMWHSLVPRYFLCLCDVCMCVYSVCCLWYVFIDVCNMACMI